MQVILKVVESEELAKTVAIDINNVKDIPIIKLLEENEDESDTRRDDDDKKNSEPS